MAVVWSVVGVPLILSAAFSIIIYLIINQPTWRRSFAACALGMFLIAFIAALRYGMIFSVVVCVIMIPILIVIFAILVSGEQGNFEPSRKEREHSGYQIHPESLGYTIGADLLP